MPIRQVPNANLNYYLINFDSEGIERSAQDGTQLSQIILQDLSTQPITDVFVMSHGWLGDVPSAVNQYDRWMGNFMSCTADIELMKQQRPGFAPMLIGLHWPSKPFGDEDTGGSFDLSSSADTEKTINSEVDRQMEI